jgi:hypothetical protein
MSSSSVPSRTFNLAETKTLQVNQRDMVTKRAFIQEAFIQTLHADNLPAPTATGLQDAMNVGAGEGAVFKEVVNHGETLVFKTLEAGTGINIADQADTITISASTSGSSTNADNVGGAEGEVFRNKTGDTLHFKTLEAGTGITIVNQADTISISSTGGGTGDVVGPAGATNNAIALFDGVTGKLLKQSSLAPVTIDGSNNIGNANTIDLNASTNQLVIGPGATTTTLAVETPGAARTVSLITSGNLNTKIVQNDAAPTAGTVRDGSLVYIGTDSNVLLGEDVNNSNPSLAGANNVVIGNNARVGTGSGNVCIGADVLGLSAVSASSSIGIGPSVFQSATGSVVNNIAIGVQSQGVIGTGTGNVSMGVLSQANNSTGSFNVSIGNNSMQVGNLPDGNVAIGNNALLNLALGDQGVGNNIAIGRSAGINYNDAVFGNVNNIVIGNNGVSTDGTNDPSPNSVIRIGSVQARCFIAGIRGVTTAINDALDVKIDSAGQLGTLSSSERYKESIETLTLEASSLLNKLRPVSFYYKKHKQEDRKYKSIGLIAEEVDTISPSLIVRQEETGLPETVKYQDVFILLLKGFQEQQVIVNAQQNLLQQHQQKLQKQEQIIQELLSTLKK